MSKLLESSTFTGKSCFSPLGTTEYIVKPTANKSINSTPSFADVAARGASRPSSGRNHSW